MNLSFSCLMITLTALTITYITLTTAQVDNLQCHILVVNGRNNSAYCCSDNQCKSTICSEHECKCKALNGACGKNVECCSGNCNSTTRKCVCSEKLGVCSLSSDCCSGYCSSDGTCDPKDDGTVCTLNSDCTSNHCNPNGICGCKKSHEACTSDGDCCSEGGVTCNHLQCCIRPGEGLNPDPLTCCSGFIAPMSTSCA